ncbi:MAG: hypothetical protein HY238_02435 [Acidobacteria bacterium]|nr:hypothetical protein [Acidobacteriota bacterium]
MKRRGLQAVAVLLSGLLVGGPLAAQRAGLKILVIDGEGAINNIQLGSGREPVVEVRDEADKPVAGAKVTFSLPERGPGGTFFGASRNLTIATNEQGRAVGTGFRPNITEGRFQIQVTAAQGDKTATAVITQSNVLPTGGVNKVVKTPKKFGAGKIVLLLAAAGIWIGIGATRGGGETTTTTTTPGTTITPGTVTVGTPR